MEHKTDTFLKTDTIRVPVSVITNKVRWQDKAAWAGVGVLGVLGVLGLLVIIMLQFKRN